MQRSFAQFESDRRPAGNKRPLTDQMVARHHVLEELGYAEGWTLTHQGQLLRSIYHECDLLIAESITAGVFEGLEPAELAGLLSCFVYESQTLGASRRTRRTRSPRRRSASTTTGSASERRVSICRATCARSR